MPLSSPISGLGMISDVCFTKPSHPVTSDQICSLVYSFSGMYFVGCFYTHFLSSSPLSIVPTLTNFESSRYASFLDNVTTPYQPEASAAKSVYQGLVSLAYDPRAQEAWSMCGAAQNWGWYYLLAILPFLVRFVQSLRRYRDSKLPTHLINVRSFMITIHFVFTI